MRVDDFRKVADRFSKADREAMNAAQFASIMCPPTGILDLRALPGDLGKRLKEALLEVLPAPGTRGELS